MKNISQKTKTFLLYSIVLPLIFTAVMALLGAASFAIIKPYAQQKVESILIISDQKASEEWLTHD